MSSNPFNDDDEIPDYIKEMLKNFAKQFKFIDQDELAEIFKKFNQLDPEEVEEFFRKSFGEDFVDKLSNLGEGIFGNISESFDPSKFSDIKQFKFNMNDFSFTPQNPSTKKSKKDITIEEEAYFEIIDKNDTESEIIIDLPGISDQRHINWEIIDDKLHLEAKNSGLKYTCVIPLPDGIIIQKHLSKINNSVFILPLRRK